MMNTKIRLWVFPILFSLSSVFFTNCIEDVTIPTVSTNEVTEVTQTKATSGGIISSDGGVKITEHGVCWSTSQTPTIADNKTTEGAELGGYTSLITGLLANTTYYVRAYATNNKGTGYGSVRSFKTLDMNKEIIVFNPNITYGTMTDIDGNTYKTVTIGTQTWMAENLKVTKYNDGTSIPIVSDSAAWSVLTTGAYCNYENEQCSVAIYGRLYNWYAVNTGKLCPTGWHVPTDTEWTTFINYLGGEDAAGGKLKEIGIAHWQSPNEGATNESGFTALPSGFRGFNGTFGNIGYSGLWWSATNDDANKAWLRDMFYGNSVVNRSNRYKGNGFSVRCVKD